MGAERPQSIAPLAIQRTLGARSSRQSRARHRLKVRYPSERRGVPVDVRVASHDAATGEGAVRVLREPVVSRRISARVDLDRIGTPS